MKKIIPFIIALIFIASVILVSYFGTKIYRSNPITYVSKIEIFSFGDYVVHEDSPEYYRIDVRFEDDQIYIVDIGYILRTISGAIPTNNKIKIDVRSETGMEIDKSISGGFKVIIDDIEDSDIITITSKDGAASCKVDIIVWPSWQYDLYYGV
ncbi:MAG: hypothetical protein LBV55_03705 [Acholeplasmatales bacterium]|jgi:hypothetical protein|nr:hypothetical protein [Acholeplasmatales bacterium]